MADRELSFDLLARDHASGPVEELGRNFDRTRERLDKFNRAGRDAGRGNADLAKSNAQATDTLKKFATAAASAVLATGRLGAAGAVTASVIAPLAATLASGAIAAAKFGAQVAPAAAALLPLAAGGALVKATFGDFGAALTEQLPDVVEALTAARTEAQRLAIDGIRPAAQEFVRANLPEVSAAMRRVGSATGAAASTFGEFINSAEGVAIVRDVSQRTAGVFELLATKGEVLGEALVRLAGRASGTAFDSFGAGADAALTKLTAVVDGISAADVDAAFDTLGDTARTAGDGLRALGDGLAWLDANQEAITRFADGMAVAGIVVGVATGGWLIALGGALSLITRHWDDISDGIDSVIGAFDGIDGSATALQPTLTGFADLWGDIQAAATDFVDQVAPHVEPFLDRLAGAFLDIQPAIVGWTAVLGPAIGALGHLAGVQFGALLDGLGLVASAVGWIAHASAATVATVLDTFADLVEPMAGLAQKLGLPFADELAGFAAGARTAATKVQGSLDAVDTQQARTEVQQLKNKIATLKGKKVKTEADRAAIRESERRLRELQARINAMQGKTLYVTTIAQRIGSDDGPAYRQGISSGIKRQADGGIVQRLAAGGLAGGGRIPLGLGGPRQDNVLTLLSAGEYVINAAATRSNLALLESINAGTTTTATTTPRAPLTRTPTTPRDQRVILEFVGDGDLVQLLRKAVRVRGGNVQVVLGQGRA